MAGWDVDFLQNAVNTCTNLSGEVSDCELFTLQDDASAAQCTFPMPSQLKDDDCSGPRHGLCGGVPVQSGPAYATKKTTGFSIQPTPTDNGSDDSDNATPTSLGYRPGTSVATDNSGGGITAAEYKPSIAHAVQIPAPSESNSAQTVVVAAAPSPAVTQSPDASTYQNGDPKAISTTTYTSYGIVWDVYIESVQITTTITAAPAVKRRRHVHRRRGRHAGIGGTF